MMMMMMIVGNGRCLIQSSSSTPVHSVGENSCSLVREPFHHLPFGPSKPSLYLGSTGKSCWLPPHPPSTELPKSQTRQYFLATGRPDLLPSLVAIIPTPLPFPSSWILCALVLQLSTRVRSTPPASRLLIRLVSLLLTWAPLLPAAHCLLAWLAGRRCCTLHARRNPRFFPALFWQSDAKYRARDPVARLDLRPATPGRSEVCNRTPFLPRFSQLVRTTLAAPTSLGILIHGRPF